MRKSAALYINSIKFAVHLLMAVDAHYPEEP